MKRLFIAINLSEEVKDAVEEALLPMRTALPMARFIARENWHITLVFLGSHDEDAQARIMSSLSESAAHFVAPRITLSDIRYGPPDGTPRMVWGVGDSPELARIKHHVENLLKERSVSFRRDYRHFNLHITLARFHKPVSKRLLPACDIPLSLSFVSPSIEIMESHLSRKGARYTTIASDSFQKPR